MIRRESIAAAIAPAILILIVCARQPAQVSELGRFPLDNLEGIIQKTDVEMDTAVSSDGNGAVRISRPESTTVRLFEVGDIDIENARLVYQARVRCEALNGIAYLEMFCHFPGRGEFFSRGLQSTLTGTMDWTTAETTFFFKKGEKPDFIRLNLVVAGMGTVWIDDIRLLKAPLG